eukprot:13364205-Ditylum_brightwellii.AAC.2
MTEAMLELESKIPNQQKAWWSNTLHNAHFKVKYWRVKLSQEKHQYEDHSVFTAIQDKIQEFLEQPAEEMMDNKATMDRERVMKRIKEVENSKMVFNTLQRYLQVGDRLGLTHVDMPDWGRVELLCAMGFTTLFNHVQLIQIWMMITCTTLFFNQVDWQQSLVIGSHTEE